MPEDQLPEDERLKVKCGRKHFKALGNPVQVLEDYKVVRHLADD